MGRTQASAIQLRAHRTCFREEGLYAFRFDLKDDAHEEVTFKIRFGEVTHAAGDEGRRVQSFEVRRATGHFPLRDAHGDLLVKGRTGQIAMFSESPKLFRGAEYHRDRRE